MKTGEPSVSRRYSHQPTQPARSVHDVGRLAHVERLHPMGDNPAARLAEEARRNVRPRREARPTRHRDRVGLRRPSTSTWRTAAAVPTSPVIPIDRPTSTGAVPGVFQADARCSREFLKGEGVAAMSYSHGSAESAYNAVAAAEAYRSKSNGPGSVSRAIDVLVDEAAAGQQRHHRSEGVSAPLAAPTQASQPLPWAPSTSASLWASPSSREPAASPRIA